MALVLDPTTGQLVDDGTGPQGRPALTRGTAAPAQQPAIGGAGQRGVVPSYTVTPTAGGPRGTGPVITPTEQPSLAAMTTPTATQPQVAASPAPQPAVDPQIEAARAEAARVRDYRAQLAAGPVPEESAVNIRQVAGEGRAPGRPVSIPGLQAVADRLVENSRAPAPIAGERGNYNMANTSNVDAQGNITSRLRQPDNIIEGGYGQFGGGRAQAYLSRFAAPRQGGMSEASDEVRLRNQLASENPFERRAAREQVANRQALQLDAGATQRQGMQLEAEQLRAQLSGLATLQAAQATAAGRQAAAQTEAQSRVEAAQATALGRLGAAQVSAGSGANSLSQVRAEQIARQLAVAQAAEEMGDLGARDRALGISQGAPGRVQTDALGNPIGISTPTGVRPLTPEEIAQLRAASAQYSVPAQ